ncbi:PQQ-dependent sugar dehydrogenase [Myxococcota bacterium]|nr:PQQ-dependent sugar dehydrogenase [Myxococcota bacterium]
MVNDLSLERRHRLGPWLGAVLVASLGITACDDDDEGPVDSGMMGTTDGGDAGAHDGGGTTDAAADGGMGATDGGGGDGGTSGATGALEAALDEGLGAARIIAVPELRGQLATSQAALRQAQPYLLRMTNALTRALTELGQGTTNDAGAPTGRAIDAANAALAELQVASQIGAAILAQVSADEGLIARWDELLVHAVAAISQVNLALAELGAGPSAAGQGRKLDVRELDAPDGYEIEVLADDLSFVSAIAIGDDGTVYAAEAGYAYGNIRAPARVLSFANGTMEELATGFDGPIAGLAISGDRLFVSHRGTISAIDRTNGMRTDLVTDLPAKGDHFNENVVVGPDGRVYFTIGTVTNSGVVGIDNYLFGWLPESPDLADVACRDLTLTGVNFTSGDPLTTDPTDTATTGAFLPFGTPSTMGQVIMGQLPCNGAVLSMAADGTDLRLYADGFRNPYGLAFAPDGTLYVTENGPDLRGSRPVYGPDNFYAVTEGGWYGWPDYYGGVPVSDPSRTGGIYGDMQRPLLMSPPMLAGMPMATFDAHSASNGFDFARTNQVGTMGSAYVAQFGDLTPVTSGGAIQRAGRKIVEVTPNGDVRDFLTITGAGTTTATTTPAFRPTDVKIARIGDVEAMFIAHFGDVQAAASGIVPSLETGALIRVTRTGTTAGQ